MSSDAFTDGTAASRCLRELAAAQEWDSLISRVNAFIATTTANSDASLSNVKSWSMQSTRSPDLDKILRMDKPTRESLFHLELSDNRTSKLWKRDPFVLDDGYEAEENFTALELAIVLDSAASVQTILDAASRMDDVDRTDPGPDPYPLLDMLFNDGLFPFANSHSSENREKPLRLALIEADTYGKKGGPSHAPHGYRYDAVRFDARIVDLLIQYNPGCLTEEPYNGGPIEYCSARALKLPWLLRSGEFNKTKELRMQMLAHIQAEVYSHESLKYGGIWHLIHRRKWSQARFFIERECAATLCLDDDVGCSDSYDCPVSVPNRLVHVIEREKEHAENSEEGVESAKLVKCMLKLCSDDTIRGLSSATTPLHRAARLSSNCKLIEELILAWPQGVAALNTRGQTPLDCALMDERASASRKIKLLRKYQSYPAYLAVLPFYEVCSDFAMGDATGLLRRIPTEIVRLIGEFATGDEHPVSKVAAGKGGGKKRPKSQAGKGGGGGVSSGKLHKVNID
jgi:hypothetical protein